MTISEIHAKVVEAYSEAISGTEFANVKIVPIDRQTDDIVRGTAETEYDGAYSREMMLKAVTVNEDLYYYASNPKTWKAECNRFQETIEERLLRGIGDLEVTDASCETGKSGDAGGVLHIAFSVTDYEETDFDGREAEAEYMEEINTELTIKTE